MFFFYVNLTLTKRVKNWIFKKFLIISINKSLIVCHFFFFYKYMPYDFFLQ